MPRGKKKATSSRSSSPTRATTEATPETAGAVEVVQTTEGVQVFRPGAIVRPEGPDRAVVVPRPTTIVCPYCDGPSQRVGSIKGLPGASYHRCTRCVCRERGRPTTFKVVPG